MFHSKKMRQFPLSYDTMTENKYLNAGHFLGQLILNRSIFPKPLLFVKIFQKTKQISTTQSWYGWFVLLCHDLPVRRKYQDEIINGDIFNDPKFLWGRDGGVCHPKYKLLLWWQCGQRITDLEWYLSTNSVQLIHLQFQIAFMDGWWNKCWILVSIFLLIN